MDLRDIDNISCQVSTKGLSASPANNGDVWIQTGKGQRV